jgi:hypothetical protein
MNDSAAPRKTRNVGGGSVWESHYPSMGGPFRDVAMRAHTYYPTTLPSRHNRELGPAECPANTTRLIRRAAGNLNAFPRHIHLH